MDPSAYAEMRLLEDRHFWFRGKRRLVTPLLRAALAGGNARVIEVGCGTGGNLAHLLSPRIGVRSAVGIDLDPTALNLARGRGGHAVLCGDGGRLPLATESVDCLLALDFIEHVEDDGALLTEFRRVLKPRGQLVASVPAYPSMWSPHDEVLHHKRRYRTGELEQRLTEAGFLIQRRSGFNFLLLPLIWVVRRIRSARRASGRGAQDTDLAKTPEPLNSLLALVFVLESVLVRVLPIRFGLSFLVRAERGEAGHCKPTP